MMVCRFCEETFEQGGREAVQPILLHVAKEHPTELLNLCVRLPFLSKGGNTTELAYEQRGERIRPVPATQDAMGRLADSFRHILDEARPDGEPFVPEYEDYPDPEWDEELNRFS